MGQIVSVNRSHPLNVARKGWWKATPGRFGGPAWRDLIGPYHGTLANGPLWQPTTRPGGCGQILFDGVDDAITCGGASDLNPPAGAGASLALWANATAWSGTQRFLAGKWSGSSPFAGYWIRHNGSGVFQAGLGGGSTLFATGASGLSTGVWYRALLTYDLSTLSLYVNGVLASSTPASGNVASTSNAFGIGSGLSNFFSGPIDDVSVWYRGLSAGEVALEYQLSRRGNPGVLTQSAEPSVFLMGGMAASGSVGTASGTSTASGAGASTASSTGTASGTSSASGSGAAIDASTGSSSGASTASGAGASTAASVGTASGTSAASGVGSALDASSGTASGTSSASGAGGSTAASTGTAAGTSTAAGVGSSGSAGSGTGTAYGTSTASGFGSAVDASTGTSSGTSAASGSGGAIHGASGTATGHATATGGGATQTSIPPIVLTPAAWLLFMTRDDSPAITPVDISDDIPDGIRDRFLATDGTAWITGGMTEGLVARKKRAKYYISFHDITGSDTYVTGTPWFVSDRVYQFDCFAPTRAEARKMAELLVDIYHPLAENIPTQAGLIFGMNSLPGGGMGDAGVDSPDATPLYKYTRDFSFSVTRPRSTS